MALLLAALVALASAAPAPPAECAARTGSSATLIVPVRPALERAGAPLAPGDEISVFAQDGTCVGTTLWDGDGAAVTVWGDDPTTPEADGLRPGDPVLFVVRDGTTGATHAASTVTFEPGFELDGGYRTDGLFAIASTDALPAPPDDLRTAFAINEVDVDQGADDTAQFVEVRSRKGLTMLDGVTLAFVDGAGQVYSAVDLGGLATDEVGLLTLRSDGPHGADVADSTAAVVAGLGGIRGGVGAVALYEGPASTFAPGAQAGTDGLLDAVVFGQAGAGRSDDLLERLGQAVQYVEGSEGSLQRLEVADSRAAARGAHASGLLHPRPASPGAANGLEVTVDRTSDVQDAPGLRLVSVPVVGVQGSPLAVGDLADVNLVRGVDGGELPAQYPDATPNVFTGLDPVTGDFIAARSADDEMAPGRGFFWHWFDEETAPGDADGGGTSRGRDLGGDAFALAATGVPVDDAVLGGPYARSVSAPAADGVHFIGNPYPYPLRLSGLSVEGGTLQGSVAVWDPVRQTYEDLFADAPDDVLPVWGGAVAEVTGVSGTFRVVTTSAAVDPTAAAPVERAARRRTTSGAPRLSLRVEGTLLDGTAVADASAHVRFVEGATMGWDAHDGSKLAPPTDAYALIAPVGERGGSPIRQRVFSLPADVPAHQVVPVAFWTTDGGSFTLRWDVETLPAEWEARLVDRATGTAVDLRTRDEYAFETDGTTTWGQRFEVTVGPAPSTSTEGPAVGEAWVGAVYPNPSVGPVRLDVRPASPERVAADVFDALGRRVLRAFDGPVPSGASETLSVDTAGLAPGLYVVRVVGETFRETRRFVVAR